jgi:hypothetical protein
MRRLTKAQPIGGASAWSCASPRRIQEAPRPDGRQELGHLHDRPLQAAEHARELRRLGAAVGFPAERARSDHLCRHPPNARADPRIARKSSGKTVGFVVALRRH